MATPHSTAAAASDGSTFVDGKRRSVRQQQHRQRQRQQQHKGGRKKQDKQKKKQQQQQQQQGGRGQAHSRTDTREFDDRVTVLVHTHDAAAPLLPTVTAALATVGGTAKVIANRQIAVSCTTSVAASNVLTVLASKVRVDAHPAMTAHTDSLNAPSAARSSSSKVGSDQARSSSGAASQLLGGAAVWLRSKGLSCRWHTALGHCTIPHPSTPPPRQTGMPHHHTMTFRSHPFVCLAQRGGRMKVLMGVEHRTRKGPCLCFLAGKVDEPDQDVYHTAAREFFEVRATVRSARWAATSHSQPRRPSAHT